MAQLQNFRETPGGLIADVVDGGRVIEVVHLTTRLRDADRYAEAIEFFRDCETIIAPDEPDPAKRRDMVARTLRERVVWLDEAGALRSYTAPMVPEDVERVARYYAKLPGYRVLNGLPLDEAVELWQRAIEDQKRGGR